MSIILKPPTPVPTRLTSPSLFLAGSIEMGRATNWQHHVEEALQHYSITIFNPRRDDWDATWTQSITNPQFVAQVQWELDAQAQADRILMYFAPETQAPITLLELGLFAQPANWWCVVLLATGAKATWMWSVPATRLRKWQPSMTCVPLGSGGVGAPRPHKKAGPNPEALQGNQSIPLRTGVPMAQAARDTASEREP